MRAPTFTGASIVLESAGLTMMLAGLFAGSTSGAVIGVVEQLEDDRYAYSYTVDNSEGEFAVFAWSLQLELPADAVDWSPLAVSDGGGVVTPEAPGGDPFGRWIAEDGSFSAATFTQDFLAADPLGNGDIVMGATLAGFSFISASPPGRATFSEYGNGGEVSTGNTLGPSLPVRPPEVMWTVEKRLRYLSELGVLYQLQVSRDLVTWEDGRVSLEGTGAMQEITPPFLGAQNHFRIHVRRILE